MDERVDGTREWMGREGGWDGRVAGGTLGFSYDIVLNTTGMYRYKEHM